MKISEINFTQSLWLSSSCGAPYLKLITASFQAQTNISNYNITASIQQYQQSVFGFIITASGAGGGGGTGAGSGGGGGAVVSSSATIQPNLIYEINIGEGGTPNNSGGTTTFIGCNRTINVYAGGGIGGANAAAGGDSGIGYIIQDGVTSSLYPAFQGGAGAFQSSAFGPRIAGGGGASNTANGEAGVIAGDGSANGGDGASQGIASGSYGGGGGYQGAGPTPPVPGSDGAAGTGTFGGGGDGASTLGGGSGRAASAGGRGILIIKHIGSGSLFTTTNASSSYDSNSNMTVYTFTSGSGTLLYQPIPTLS